MANEARVPEARALIEALRVKGVEARLMGGVAVALRSPSSDLPSLRRPHDDVDLVVGRKSGRRLEEAMKSLGFDGNLEFNAMQGSRRLLFYSEREAPMDKVDAFINEVEMCHAIRLENRLDLDPHTLSLADLLLLKLQIVELNRKDAMDVAALVLDHPVTNDESGINAEYLAGLCGNDWGLWKTVTTTMDRLRTESAPFLDPDQQAVLASRFGQLADAIEAAPRARRWKLRARVGERVRWYELPEEIVR